MSDFIAHVIAELDTSKAQSALNAFTKGKHTIDVDVNLTSKNGNVNNILNQIKSQFQSAGSTAGKGFANNINASLNSINVKNAASQISNLQRTLKSMNFSSPSIDMITKDLQEMDVAVSKVTTRMSGKNLNVRVDGIDQMGRAVTVVKEFDAATGRMQRTSETVATSMKTMFSNVDASKLSASISTLDANFVKLKGSVNNESTALAKLKTDLANISNINGLDKQQAEFERITAEVGKLSIAYKQASAENKALVSSQQLLSNKSILGNQITSWMGNNTKAAKIYRTELEAIQRQLSTVSNASEFKAVSSQFMQLKSTAAAAGNLGKSAFSTLISNVTKLSPLFGMGTMLMTSINGVKSMMSSVVSLDTALVDLQKTTTMSSAQLSTFYGDANKVAIQMGVSTEEIINQTSAWSRLGYSSAEASTKMAKLSSQFASISPDMDTDQATDGLVSIMKAYDIDVDNVLDGVMSKINIIGNTAATTNGEIVTMLSKSSSAMHEANNSLEQTIALETAAVEITRDPESVGTAYKTVAMRIRGYDEETESYTNDVEMLSGKIADLTKTASTPGGISLFTDDTKTEYKSTYQLLEEISEIYDQLSDKDQAGLLEALAGKRQGQIIAATIGNFDAAKKAMDSMSNSAGSADAEMAIIMGSLEYKLNALKETGTGVAQNLFKREDMKVAVDGLTSLLSVVEKVTGKLGLFGTIGAGVGIVALIKNISGLKNVASVFTAITSSTAGLGSSISSLKQFSTVLASLGGTSIANVSKLQAVFNMFKLNGDMGSGVATLTKMSAAMKTFDGSAASISAVVASMDGLSAGSQIAALSMFNLSEAQATAILSAAGLTGEELAAGVAAVTAGSGAAVGATGFTAFAASVKAAAAGLATFLLTNPVGWAILAGGAIFAGVKIFDALTESMEEAKEKAEESRSAYETTASEITSINSELENTKARMAELEGMGTLSVTEQQEYDNLVQQNEQLERQLQIKEKLASYQLNQAAKDANNVLTKEQSYTTGETETQYIEGFAIETPIEKQGDIIDKVKAKQEQLNIAQQNYNKAQEELSNMEPDFHKNWWEGDTAYETKAKQVESLKNTTESLNKEISDGLAEISTQYDSLFDEEGNVLPGFEDTVNRVNSVIDLTTEATSNSAESVEEAISSVTDYAAAIDSLKEKLTAFQTYQSNVNSAISDSKTATGMTTEEIDGLVEAYSHLEGYDAAKLFEETANGVHINAEELKKLNEQYESKQLEEYAKNVQDIQKEIYSQRAKGNDTSDLEAELTQAKLLQSQYEGLTSAYNDWISAKAGGNERDSYESIGSAYKDMQSTLNEGWYGDESLNTYLDLLLSAQQRTGDAATDFAKLSQTIEGTSHSIMDYWKYDENDNLVTDGLFDFLDDVNAKMGDEFAKVNENGQYEFDFDGDKLQQVADEFGMSTEAVELFERAMIDAGMAVDLSDQGIVEQISSATDSLKKFQEAGQISSDLDLDFNVDTDSLDDLRGNIDSLKNERVNIDAEANPEAAAALDDLISKCEQQYYFRLNAETDGSLDNAIGIVEQLKSLTAAPISVEARANNADEIATLAGQLASLPKDVQIAVGITAENVGSVEGIVNQLNTQPQSIQVPVNYEKGSEPESVDDAKGTANYDLGTSPTTVPDASGTANFSLGSYPTSLPSITQNVIANKIGFASGTAHADGTFGKMYNAYVQGKDWSLPQNENALVNELGTESIVRDGMWYPLPGGAHIAQLKKGDIIFSAAQTAELVRTGKVTSGGGHGQVAMANGTAYNTLNLSAYDSGSGGSRRPTSVSSNTTTSNTSTASSHASYSSTSGGSSSASTKNCSSSSSNEEKDDFEEVVDFVEIAIKRIEEAIDRVKIKAESAYKTLANKNSAVADEISLVTQQIGIQEQAYNKYMQQANAVGLSGDWAEKVRNGSIDVSTITDETLSDKIKDYQDYYEKAIEARDKTDELHEAIASLYADRFDNITSEYEHQISMLEHFSNTYDTGLDKLEAEGLKKSAIYYKALKDIEKDRSEVLNEELASLEKALSQAMKSGEIEKYSDQWYQMQEDINDVVEKIDDCSLSILELNKNIRELDWEYFDYTQERISSITDEAEFLIDLMSNGDLFDDKGNITETGTATMGLHGQNYNVYMNQADQYAQEILKLNKEIADDPYNTDLIERREKLLGLQRDSIKSAEDEKQAIIDLIHDGIDAQLDSMQDLIDKYTEGLDSAKDLFEYQKKVKEQTEDIANLQKQLSAYKNDTSEESKKTIQKIEVDLSKAMEELQETEYEQYITDQKKLLDELYTEYEMQLNTRFDDTDALISETIDTINASSSAISDTLAEQANNVGYTISDAMRNVWSNEGGAFAIISKYGDSFTNQFTAINASINGIKAYTDQLKAKADAEAAAKKAAEEAAAKKRAEEEAAKKKAATTSSQSTPATTFNEDIKRGIAAAIWVYGGSRSGWGDDPERRQKLTAKFGASNAAAVQSYINAHANNGDLYNYWVSTGKSNLSKYYYNAFKDGSERINKDQMAWTNEIGTEAIIRPTDSAIMTPLAKGDSVLNAEATKNLWDMANNPSDFISGNLFRNSIVDSASNGGQFISSIEKVEFVLPGVENYNDFMNHLVKDPKAERAIQAMTVGRMTGGSKLAKNKYTW